MSIKCPHCSQEINLVNERSLEYLGIIKRETDEKPTLFEEETVCNYEDLEELRLYLNAFLRPQVLGALLEVSKVLNLEPKFTQMIHYFIHNSQFGMECKYAVMAANNFKKNRLERLLVLIKKCAELTKEQF
jgi:hypothetical protein